MAMLRVCAFDFETTGIVNGGPLVDQPYPVSMAYQILEVDRLTVPYTRVIEKEIYAVLSIPGDAPWSKEAEAVHGISQETIATEGVDPIDFFDGFVSDSMDCDILTAYNASFDIQIGAYALARYANIGPQAAFEELFKKPVLCAMNMFLKANPQRRCNLASAFAQITKTQLQRAHNAKVDTDAAGIVFAHSLQQFDQKKLTISPVKLPAGR